MKKNTHYIFGTNFYSYGVEFWGMFFKMALADKPVYNAKRFGTMIVDNGTYKEYVELSPKMMAKDIRKPICSRTIFTRTTIRHFNFYMSEYFSISNAFDKLKAYLKIK